MRVRAPLDDLFRNRTHVRVLRALDGLPAGLPASTREIARRAGVSHPTAAAALASLREQGVVSVRRLARGDLFELKDSHVLVERLRALFEWERSLREELIAFLHEHIRRKQSLIRSAYLFGSAIRDDMEPSSDIDLAVIAAPRRAGEAIEALGEITELVRTRFGNRLNPIVGTGTLETLCAPGRPGYRLWERVSQEGIALLPASRRKPAHA